MILVMDSLDDKEYTAKTSIPVRLHYLEGL